MRPPPTSHLWIAIAVIVGTIVLLRAQHGLGGWLR